MEGLRVFDNERFGSVRVIVRDGNPWFVAKDVAACIEYSNVTKMCELCRDKDKIVVNIDDLKTNDLLVLGNRGLTCVSESGLYRILAKCNLPKCEPFESWVFDEVLPGIRRHGVYATEDFVKMAIDDPDWAVSVLLNYKQERERRRLAEAQRDEAIRTKAWIGTRREATAMNTASQKSKENEKLREQIGDSKNWKAVKAIPWLKDFFELTSGLYVAVADKLKKICLELGLEIHTIEDSNYGTIKAYPIRAIDVLYHKVQSDQKLLSKYRKIGRITEVC